MTFFSRFRIKQLFWSYGFLDTCLWILILCHQEPCLFIGKQNYPKNLKEERRGSFSFFFLKLSNRRLCKTLVQELSSYLLHALHFLKAYQLFLPPSYPPKQSVHNVDSIIGWETNFLSFRKQVEWDTLWASFPPHLFLKLCRASLNVSIFEVTSQKIQSKQILFKSAVIQS